MRDKIQTLSGYLAVVLAVFIAVQTPLTAFAIDFSIQGGANAAKGVDQITDIFGVGGIFSTITNVLLFLVGAISVLMIIFGGFRYVVSGGNASTVSAAKNTILYAVVGLIVAILGYAVINFVIGTFAPGSGGMSGGTNT